MEQSAESAQRMGASREKLPYALKFASLGKARFSSFQEAIS